MVYGDFDSIRRCHVFFPNSIFNSSLERDDMTLAISPDQLATFEAARETIDKLIGSLQGQLAQPNLKLAQATRIARYRDYIKYPSPQGLRPRALAPFRVANLCQDYNFPTGLAGGGVVGILELSTPGSDKTAWSGYTQADLDMFSNLNGLPRIVPTDVSVNDGQNLPGGDGDGEVLLDIQVVAAAYFYCTGEIPTIRMYFAPNDGSSFVAVINKAAADGCDTLSISWGGRRGRLASG